MTSDRINGDKLGDRRTFAILDRWHIDSDALLRLLCREELRRLGINESGLEAIVEYLAKQRKQLLLNPAIIGLVGRDLYVSSWEIPMQIAFIQLNRWLKGRSATGLLAGMNELRVRHIMTLGELRNLSFGRLSSVIGRDFAFLVSGWMSGAGLTPA